MADPIQNAIPIYCQHHDDVDKRLQHCLGISMAQLESVFL